MPISRKPRLPDLRIGQQLSWEWTCTAAGIIRGPHLRLHHGDRPDPCPFPRAKRHGQLREGRARLPVRIEVTDYDPDKSPLFPGPVRHADGRSEQVVPDEMLENSCRSRRRRRARCPQRNESRCAACAEVSSTLCHEHALARSAALAFSVTQRAPCWSRGCRWQESFPSWPLSAAVP